MNFLRAAQKRRNGLHVNVSNARERHLDNILNSDLNGCYAPCSKALLIDTWWIHHCRSWFFFVSCRLEKIHLRRDFWYLFLSSVVSPLTLVCRTFPFLSRFGFDFCSQTFTQPCPIIWERCSARKPDAFTWKKEEDLPFKSRRTWTFTFSDPMSWRCPWATEKQARRVFYLVWPTDIAFL